jgi:hypothetical protein
MRDRLAALLPRLTRLCIGESHSDYLLREVYAIVDRVPSQLNITDFMLINVPREHEVDAFERMLNKMPRLRDLRAPVPFNTVHRIQSLPQLEFLDWIQAEPLEDEAAAVQYLRPFATSKLGLNLNFFWQGMRCSLVGFLSISSVRGLRILHVLQAAGFTSKLSNQETLNIFLNLGTNGDEFDALVKLIAYNCHPLLPSTKELVPIAGRILGSGLPYLHDSSLQLFIDTFGIVHPEPHSIASRIFTRSDRGAVLFHLGLISVEAITHPKEETGNFFSFATSTSALEWLLSIMSKEDALRLLRQRPPQDEELPDPCPLIRFLQDEDFVTIISTQLTGLPVFCFPDPEELRQAFRSALSVHSVQLILESTGIQNISREERGNLLWCLFHHSSYGAGSFEYCLEVLESPLLIFNSDYYTKIVLEAIKISSFFSKLANNLVCLFRRHETALVHQASQLPANGDIKLVDMLSLLGSLIMSASTAVGSDWLHLSSSDVLFMIESVFTPMAQICSDRKEYPSLVMVDLMPTEVDPIDSAAERLVHICATFDLSEDGTIYQSESHGHIAAFFVARARTVADSKLAVLQKWLDKISPTAMNLKAPESSYSAMDMVLHTQVASKLSNLPDLIHRLVQRGCRLSSPDRLHNYRVGNADTEALELYFDAVRTTMGSLH